MSRAASDDAPSDVTSEARVRAPDRSPLLLVPVEQRRAPPAAQDKGELPAQVVRVRDAGVHASGPAWRRAVSRVADEEDPTQLLSSCHGRAEVPREHPEDLGLQRWQSGRRLNPLDHPLRRPVGKRLTVVRVPLDVVDPPARLARRHQHALRAGAHHEGERVGHGGDDRRQVRSEQHAQMVALGAE